MQIFSERLILRPWQHSDRRAFADMSADLRVMEYLMPLAGQDESDRWIERQIECLREHGLCFWAVERRADAAFVGAVGLLPVSYAAHFTPAVEVGWRIARAYWGLGYAPEAAAAAMTYGFGTHGLTEIIANTVPGNRKSRRVMDKLGMTHDPRDDFDHPRIAEHDPVRRQMLYRMTRDRWRAIAGDPDASSRSG